LNVQKYGPVLCLFDENSKGRLELGVVQNKPRLKLFDENGKIIWEVPISQVNET